MKVAFYMNCVSAHQLPLAKEVAELVGAEHFCYVDAGEKSESAQNGEVQGLKFKVQRIGHAVAEAATVRSESAREWLVTADQRELAKHKIGGWLEGVTPEAFEMALLKLVEEKAADGAYRFKREEEKTLALSNARKNTPPIKLLSEVVESVERHQGAGYLPSTTVSNVPKACCAVNGWRDDAREWLETADVMLTGMRDLELFERRAKRGLRTYYTSERWFKPVEFKVQGLRFKVPGWVRMFVPGYRRMVKRFVKWANEDPGARVLAIGPWAKKDFLKMGVRAEKIVDWGYFVAPSTSKRLNIQTSKHLNILWCGRMLGLKRVDTIIRAMTEFKVQGLKFKVTLVGDGPEKGRLMRLAEDVGGRCRCTVEFVFLPSQSMEKVRELMREHDLFVFPSNGYEGWGAVASEALEEGMRVLASYECGAGAALLSRERLFHSGDWKGLAKLIEKEIRGELPPCSIGAWTARSAARRLRDV